MNFEYQVYRLVGSQAHVLRVARTYDGAVKLRDALQRRFKKRKYLIREFDKS